MINIPTKKKLQSTSSPSQLQLDQISKSYPCHYCKLIHKSNAKSHDHSAQDFAIVINQQTNNKNNSNNNNNNEREICVWGTTNFGAARVRIATCNLSNPGLLFFFQISWTISTHCDYLSQFLFFLFLSLPSVRERMESRGCQPTQKQKKQKRKKRKRAFPPELPHCCHHTHTHTHTEFLPLSFPAVEGPTSYKKRKNKTKKVFFLVRDHPSPMQMKLFRLSEDVPLIVVVVVLVPSFFLANGFLICSRTRARAHTHTHQKARKANGSSQEEDS
jgi:hypothetical protein